MVQQNSYNDLLYDCIIYISYFGEEKIQIVDLCKALGGIYVMEYSEIVQYVISDGIDSDLTELAEKDGKILINYLWLVVCAKERLKVDTARFVIN